MKKTGLLLVVSLCFWATGVMAQQQKMETDRPSETQATALTEKGWFQAEIGFRKEQQNGKDYDLFHPKAQLKYGLSDRIELRAEISSKTERHFSENEFKYGLQPVELGAKTKLTEGHGPLPATSFYAQVGIPNWASEDHRQDQLLPKLRLLFENKLTKKIKLAYNAGAEWMGKENDPQWVYTLSPQVELGDKWEAFVETFAYLQKGHAPKHHVDGGFAFYLNQNLKLDLWGGKGISHEAPDYFVSAGVSFRLKP